MTKQEIYEQIVQLTSELHATNVAEKIFGAVNEENSAKFDEVFDTFKKENSDLYQKMVDFGEKFNKFIEDSETGLDGVIFGSEDYKKEYIFVFHTNIVDSLSLYALTFFARIEEVYLFDVESESFDTFVTAIAESGYENLADFIACYNWIDWVGEGEDQYPTLYELLVVVFKGEFEEETEDESEEETE